MPVEGSTDLDSALRSHALRWVRAAEARGERGYHHGEACTSRGSPGDSVGRRHGSAACRRSARESRCGVAVGARARRRDAARTCSASSPEPRASSVTVSQPRAEVVAGRATAQRCASRRSQHRALTDFRKTSRIHEFIPEVKFRNQQIPRVCCRAAPESARCGRGARLGGRRERVLSRFVTSKPGPQTRSRR